MPKELFMKLIKRSVVISTNRLSRIYYGEL